MPELPEVETIRRQLEPLIFERTVESAGSHPSEKFIAAKEMVGRTFGPIRRRGKFILFDLDDKHELVAHLGMTGKFSVTHHKSETERHLRAWWDLDDGRRLKFVDIRRFGRLAFVRSGDYTSMPALSSAGPEPFDSTLDAQLFHQLLRRSRTPIKTNLLSQRPIAGVGNIYADEALWRAKINPKTKRIGLKRAGFLLEALRDVLSQGIENGGTTLRDYRSVGGDKGSNQHLLKVYGRSGQSCMRCLTPLTSATLGGRTTTWCSLCQAR